MSYNTCLGSECGHVCKKTTYGLLMKKLKQPLGVWRIMSQKIVIFINRALQTLNHIFFMARQPLVCQSPLIIEASWSHPRRHSTMIKTSQRSLTDNTQHAKGKNIHAPGGIRTPYPSKRSIVSLMNSRSYLLQVLQIFWGQQQRVLLMSCSYERLTVSWNVPGLMISSL